MAATTPAPRDTRRRVHEARFHAMGTTAHVVVVGGEARLVDEARRAVAELEARWSRFLDTSEISRLNHAAGHPVVLSGATWDLADRALEAADRTEGRFDPLLGRCVVDLGYDRDFRLLTDRAPVDPGPAERGGRWREVDRVPGGRIVRLPEGVSFDPGGIGKGLAADLVSAAVVAGGAAGALVGLGGDLRARGTAPTGDGWVVQIDDPWGGPIGLGRVAIPSGAVATSSALQRTWATVDGPAHHLLDPRTGRSAQGQVVAVTVVAGEAWWAEARAKDLFLQGPAGLGAATDVEALVVTRDGRHHATPGLREVLR